MGPSLKTKGLLYSSMLIGDAMVLWLARNVGVKDARVAIIPFFLFTMALVLLWLRLDSLAVW